ncbi:hypothetical protein VFPPC_18568 [Pochonia chlamydosporia 170]|uniref:Uncharacterized protein n=1 Tax=Pochonia chlamydosporia 170 TaxID=1380566 RepID=A0A219ANA8_METCM|nr:hypothetical protein VFPPC_18568 [Pochonia chlamydosporia 170]OWT42316.1 hypothetical protein VFPPC_18568 [Pochonia chlamydosporia 170]
MSRYPGCQALQLETRLKINIKWRCFNFPRDEGFGGVALFALSGFLKPRETTQPSKQGEVVHDTKLVTVLIIQNTQTENEIPAENSRWVRFTTQTRYQEQPLTAMEYKYPKHPTHSLSIQHHQYIIYLNNFFS